MRRGGDVKATMTDKIVSPPPISIATTSQGVVSQSDLTHQGQKHGSCPRQDTKRPSTVQQSDSPGCDKSTTAKTQRSESPSKVHQGSDECDKCHQVTSKSQRPLNKSDREGQVSANVDQSVGRFPQAGGSGVLHSHSVKASTRPKHAKGEGCGGSNKTKGNCSRNKKSHSHLTITTKSGSKYSNRSGGADNNPNVCIGIPAYGYPEGSSVPSSQHLEGSATIAVGSIQIRPIWDQSSEQILFYSPKVPTPIQRLDLGDLSTGVLPLKEGMQGIVSALTETRSLHTVGRNGILDGRNRYIDRTHTHGRQTSGCQKVYRSFGEPTGVTAAIKNVQGTGENTDASNDVQAVIRSRPPLKQLSENLCYDPGGVSVWDPGGGKPPVMVANCLTAEQLPKGLLDGEYDSVPIKHLQISSLPFTVEEMQFLCSTDPDPEVKLDQLLESSGTKKKITFSVDGKRNDNKPRRGPCDLPLAAITTKRIDYGALLNLPLGPSADLLDALSWICTPRLRDQVANHPDFRATQSEKRYHVSRHLAEDMIPLHEAGLFHKVSRGDYAIEVPLFKVPKANNLESRLIGDCRGINKLLPKGGDMGLPLLPDLIKELLSCRYLYQTDAKSYFYAFGLCAETSEVFSVRWGHKRGIFFTSVWDVMPQGFSLASKIAQTTSLHLCKNAVSDSKCILIPWIDNFLHGTQTMDEMFRLIRDFNNVCDRVNVECKPAEQPPGTTMDALGLHFDVSDDEVSNHFVELQTTFKDHLISNLDLLGSMMTPREYFQVFGGCMWGNYAVGRHPLCRWPHALGTLRTMAIEVHKGGTQEVWDIKVAIDDTSIREVKELINELVSTRRTLRSLQNSAAKIDIWTDASGWALGYLRSRPAPLAGAHQQHFIRDIFVAELLAACNAWYSSKEDIPNIHVDNTGAVGAILKGHSRTARGNLILGRLYQCLPTSSTAMLTTVPTKCQRADLLSRGAYVAGAACDHQHPSYQVRWTK